MISAIRTQFCVYKPLRDRILILSDHRINTDCENWTRWFATRVSEGKQNKDLPDFVMCTEFQPLSLNSIRVTAALQWNVVTSLEDNFKAQVIKTSFIKPSFFFLRRSITQKVTRQVERAFICLQTAERTLSSLDHLKIVRTALYWVTPQIWPRYPNVTWKFNVRLLCS